MDNLFSTFHAKYFTSNRLPFFIITEKNYNIYIESWSACSLHFTSSQVKIKDPRNHPNYVWWLQVQLYLFGVAQIPINSYHEGSPKPPTSPQILPSYYGTLQWSLNELRVSKSFEKLELIRFINYNKRIMSHVKNVNQVVFTCGVLLFYYNMVSDLYAQ